MNDRPVNDRPVTGSWSVRVEADADYFAVVAAREGPDAERIAFPSDRVATEVALEEDEVRIGRSPAEVTLGIDLVGALADPGVSRVHAVLRAGADGWTVADPGSTNGTTINDDDEPIPADEAVPVTDGDRIHLGAWTTLVLRARP